MSTAARPWGESDTRAKLREVIGGLRAEFGRRLPLEFRMDAAFFQRDVLRLLATRGGAYAIKVGYWSWLPLKALAAQRERWLPVAPNVTGFFHDLDIPPWKLRLRVMIYRKHVAQLDLFTPDDGHFEYGAVATNLPLDLPALYAFICGCGAQEKTIAELKGEFALDVIPTRHYGANSAWQQLSALAHNLIRSFQLHTLATPKPRSRQRTYTYLIRSMRTLRFLVVTRAGRLARIGGRHVLRLSHNPATEALYASARRLSYLRIGANSEPGSNRRDRNIGSRKSRGTASCCCSDHRADAKGRASPDGSGAGVGSDWCPPDGPAPPGVHREPLKALFKPKI